MGTSQPDITSVLHDVGDEDRESAARHHSERIAVAFGHHQERETLRVVKNLQTCKACRLTIKLSSMLFKRRDYNERPRSVSPFQGWVLFLQYLLC